MTPLELREQLIAILIESSDIKTGSQCLDTVQLPRLSVVDRVGRNQVRYYCSEKIEIVRRLSNCHQMSNSRRKTIALNNKSASIQNPHLQRRSCPARSFLKGTSPSFAQEQSTTANPCSLTTSLSEGDTACSPLGLKITQKKMASLVLARLGVDIKGTKTCLM